MKTLGSLTAALAALLLTTTTTPAYAADRVDLSRPATLDRGDDVRLPHLEGNVIVDGDRRIEVRNVVALEGKTGDDYVVSVKRRNGRYTVKRVSVTGEHWVLLRGKEALYVELTSDGEYLLRNSNTKRAVITAYDATDGTEVAQKSFREWGSVIGSGDGVVYVSRWSPSQRVIAWDVAAGTRTSVVEQFGGLVDTDADRMLVYTGDPYEGGCSEVRVLSAPDTVVWESCRQRVATFSPDGSLMATIHILSDGIGPGEVQLRDGDGTLQVRYRADWFGAIQWEDADTLLLEANGQRKGAVVRCDGTDCERAGELYKPVA